MYDLGSCRFVCLDLCIHLVYTDMGPCCRGNMTAMVLIRTPIWDLHYQHYHPSPITITQQPRRRVPESVAPCLVDSRVRVHFTPPPPFTHTHNVHTTYVRTHPHLHSHPLAFTPSSFSPSLHSRPNRSGSHLKWVPITKQEILCAL